MKKSTRVQKENLFLFSINAKDLEKITNSRNKGNKTEKININVISNIDTDYDSCLVFLIQELMKKKTNLQQIENDILFKVLDLYGGNIIEASEKTYITRDRFYRLLKKNKKITVRKKRKKL